MRGAGVNTLACVRRGKGLQSGGVGQPSRHIRTAPSLQSQVVVGMLLKYVNLTSGWRHRLFVLDGGVLRYYKVQQSGGTARMKLLLAWRGGGRSCSVQRSLV